MIHYQNIKPWTKGYAVIFQNVQTAMDEAIAAVEEKLKRQQEIQNKKVCLYQIVHYDMTLQGEAWYSIPFMSEIDQFKCFTGYITL